MQKQKNLSFKKYFFYFELIIIIFILLIIIFLTFFSLKMILKMTLEKQNYYLNSFTQELEFLKNHLIEHFDIIKTEKDIEIVTKFAPSEFSEIFTLDKNYKVKKTYRKDSKSIIFNGFSFENLYLKDFIENKKNLTLFTTDIIRTINNNICFYYIKLIDNDTYLIAEINLEDLIYPIASGINIKDSMFIIANNNRYIFYNSDKEKGFYFLPKIIYNNFCFIDKNLYLILNAFQSDFNINLAILIPFKYIFKEFILTLLVFLFSAVFLVFIFFVKNIINNKYFLLPLTKTTKIISSWDIKELENEIPKFFLGFKEVADLTNTIIKKYFEFANEYEQLQEAEKTIRNMQKYLKNLIDSLPSAIISIDLSGKIIEWNKKAEELTKVKKEDAIGKNYNEAFPYLAKFKEDIKQIFNTNETKRFFKETYDEKEEKIFNVNIIPINQNGNSGIAFRIDDITEIEKLEKQIRQSQQMEIVGLLAGGIAHDFNNVLTGIISSISLIKQLIDENPSIKNPELIEYIDILENSSERARDIVQKILTISRKKEEKLLPINLKSCINDVERVCKSTFDKSIELNFVNPFSEAIILGDHNLIVQALLNLCINSSHAMTIMRKTDERIGGTLTVKLEIANQSDKHLNNFKKQNSQISEKEFWKITISDNGTGIPQELQSKIFEPFFTTKQAFYGSGLGLSTVKMIVNQHNGFITFESEEGKGTSFYIYLPIFKIDKFLETEKAQDSIKKGKGLILLIDDDQIVRSITKAMLMKLGYTVLLASNGVEGLKIFYKHKQNIKLVILDIAMPGKSGIDTFKEIKLKNNQTKVLFITGLKIDDKIKKIIDEDAVGFLPKPFSISQLSNKIYEIISKTNF
ncbi:MAG: response regulator [Exilispira sp.]